MKMKKIDCYLTQKAFSPLRDQWLYPEEENKVLEHLKGCQECETSWQQYNVALDLLHEPLTESQALSPRVWERFNDSLKKEKGEWLEEVRVEDQLVPLRWGSAFALGVAATLLLGLFLTEHHQIQEIAAQNFLTESQYGKVLSIF